MTILNQSLSLMSGSTIDVNDVVYYNRLNAVSVHNVVGDIPVDFHLAAICRDGTGSVATITFFKDNYFNEATILDWEMYAEKFETAEMHEIPSIAFNELCLHKDAVFAVDALNFTVVLNDGGVEEDVDLSHAICVIDLQDLAMDITLLSEEERNAINQAISGGAEAFDKLPILDKPVALKAGIDFYQDIHYKDRGTLRLLIVDGAVRLDPYCKFSTVEGEPSLYMRMAITEVAAGVQITPNCMN